MPSVRQLPPSCEGFARVYEEHLDVVFRTALSVVHDRQLAEDIAQDVFLDHWRRPDRFDASRGDLRPYLRLRARSRAIDVHRAQRARTRMHDQLAGAVATRVTVAPDAAAGAAERERRSLLAAALRDLPDEQRDAVALVHVAGLSTVDFAVSRSLPLGTAKSRVRLGLQKLRSGLGPLAQPVTHAGG